MGFEDKIKLSDILRNANDGDEACQQIRDALWFLATKDSREQPFLWQLLQQRLVDKMGHDNVSVLAQMVLQIRVITDQPFKGNPPDRNDLVTAYFPDEKNIQQVARFVAPAYFAASNKQQFYDLSHLQQFMYEVPLQALMQTPPILSLSMLQYGTLVDQFEKVQDFHDNKYQQILKTVQNLRLQFSDFGDYVRDEPLKTQMGVVIDNANNQLASFIATVEDQTKFSELDQIFTEYSLILQVMERDFSLLKGTYQPFGQRCGEWAEIFRQCHKLFAGRGYDITHNKINALLANTEQQLADIYENDDSLDLAAHFEECINKADAELSLFIEIQLSQDPVKPEHILAVRTPELTKRNKQDLLIRCWQRLYQERKDDIESKKAPRFLTEPFRSRLHYILSDWTPGWLYARFPRWLRDDEELTAKDLLDRQGAPITFAAPVNPPRKPPSRKRAQPLVNPDAQRPAPASVPVLNSGLEGDQLPLEPNNDDFSLIRGRP